MKIPKKGNLVRDGNWRAVTLLSVPSKVFCAVPLKRLSAAVDSEM